MHAELGKRQAVLVGDGASICVESIGERQDPALLLIAANSWSMDWWEDELCERIVARRRRVVRYDNRDTGRSISYPPGAPGYGGGTLIADAIGVLDALQIERAHPVGLSSGGGIAQALALEHRDRVASLTLISTSPIDPTVGELPGMEPRLRNAISTEIAEVDWADREAVIDNIVERNRPYAGPGTFDKARLRTIAGRAFDRSNDIEASLTNHDLLEPGGPANTRLTKLKGLPTLVVHGSADPLFPPAHGRALAAAIPGARLIELDGVGHQLPPPHTWDTLIGALMALSEQNP
jgi:pimeloyl-ACP methyl ester carboxylesterase